MRQRKLSPSEPRGKREKACADKFKITSCIYVVVKYFESYFKICLIFKFRFCLIRWVKVSLDLSTKVFPVLIFSLVYLMPF